MARWLPSAGIIGPIEQGGGLCLPIFGWNCRLIATSISTFRLMTPGNKKFPTKKQLHEGIDLKSVDVQRRPVAVLAAQRGVVDLVDNFPDGYGNYVRIRHDCQMDAPM